MLKLNLDSCHGVYNFLSDIYAKYVNTPANLLVKALSCFNVCPATADTGAELQSVYEVGFVPYSGGCSIVFNHLFDVNNVQGFPYDKFCTWLRNCIAVFEVSKIDY